MGGIEDGEVMAGGAVSGGDWGRCESERWAWMHWLGRWLEARLVGSVNAGYLSPVSLYNKILPFM